MAERLLNHLANPVKGVGGVRFLKNSLASADKLLPPAPSSQDMALERSDMDVLETRRCSCSSELFLCLNRALRELLTFTVTESILLLAFDRSF